jgi:endonuclease YncB( thermonuclease family)
VNKTVKSNKFNVPGIFMLKKLVFMFSALSLVCAYADLGRIDAQAKKATKVTNNSYIGKVVGVSDGDTITVLKAGNVQDKIRLDGIDAPEKSQPYGKKAKQMLSRFVFGENVKVVVINKDGYGRTVADLYVGEINVNYALVESGYAWHYKKYSSSSSLASAEKNAKAKKIGLWKDAHPIAPWDYRVDKKHASYAKKIKNNNLSTDYWISTNGNTRHNAACRYYKNTKSGYIAKEKKGVACCVCGG